MKRHQLLHRRVTHHRARSRLRLEYRVCKPRGRHERADDVGDARVLANERPLLDKLLNNRAQPRRGEERKGRRADTLDVMEPRKEEQPADT